MGIERGVYNTPKDTASRGRVQTDSTACPPRRSEQVD
jgi:hypothetical protein